MRFLSRSTITARQFSFIYKKCPGFRRGYSISNECDKSHICKHMQEILQNFFLLQRKSSKSLRDIELLPLFWNILYHIY